MEKREGNKRVRGGDRVSEIEKEGKIKSSLKEEYRNNELGWGERQKKGQRQADIKMDYLVSWCRAVVNWPSSIMMVH